MVTTIKANGIDISYRLDGPKNAPVVMLSNSLMSNYSMWDYQMEELTAKFRVLRYDQRGHGGTQTTPGPYTVELLAEDAAALIDALDLGRVHFVGLSMGGFTGQILGFTCPEKLLSLVLCDTACVMTPTSLWNERIETAREKGIEALAPGTLERWFTPPFHESGKDDLEKIRAMILGTKVDGYIACAQAIRDMFLCDKLSEIDLPTLILVGADDPACPVSAAEQMHKGISGSELVVLANSAHLPNIEQRSAFNETLMAFLNKQ
jgi:3-oxoadipate enol-lactonase